MYTRKHPNAAPKICERIIDMQKGRLDNFPSFIKIEMVTAGLKCAPPANPKNTMDRNRVMPIANG